ncbi:polysaccharide biosynthesis protein PelA [Pararobbsia alpina]|uniref:sugar ABC transporter n=1 Tax=Pararobbsia alpina TaxID=621374 RepID=UPI0039A74597
MPRVAQAAPDAQHAVALAFAKADGVNASGAAPDSAAALGHDGAPNIAFFYSKPTDVVVPMLQAYDAVVVAPSTGFHPDDYPLAHTTWVARVDLAHADADSANLSGAFVEQTIAPLAAQGYAGFAFDGIDALLAGAPNDEVRATRAHNVATLIDTVEQRFPNARLIQYGGASLLQQSHPHLYAYVTGSVIRTFDPARKAVVAVPDAQRAATLADARRIHDTFHVPVVSIDFCAATDRACARDTARAARIAGADAGVTPYVTDPSFDTIGVGRIEVMPRRILLVQDRDGTQPLDESPGVRDVATPLNYLGYTVDYADIGKPLPDHVTPDRYAGVVVWVDQTPIADVEAWRQWIRARIGDNVKVVFFSDFGFQMDADTGAALGLTLRDGRPRGPITIVSKDPGIGFEVMPAPDARDADGIEVGDNGTPLLRLKAGDFVYDPVAITPWGGYALSPYTIASLNTIGQERWAIQPIDFLRRALALEPMPMPDTTTENGRRFFMVHVDGDGFASRCEFPGPDFSGQALYDRLFSKYRVPTTLSVIEGEVGPAGLYPKLSPRLEEIARQMFALPNVEIGTHTYSHPFEWEDVQESGQRVKHNIDEGGGDAAFSLNIPGYTFDLDREISGSISYINKRLAPPGKKVKILQWSGNCEPPGIAVRRTYEAGALNINGGDTVITKTADSWTNIAPIGVDKGPGAYQVYAPNQDENVYTDDWQGPFYGFTRVLETFAMTDEPRRFKPIDLYFHMYSGTKIASLRALEQIYEGVLKQSVFPIYTSEYARKVLDWRDYAVARDGDHGWLVRGNGELRELRFPTATTPDLAHSQNVAGYTAAPDGTYIHVAGSSASFDIAQQADAASATQPYVKSASAYLRKFSRGAHSLSFEAGGYYQPNLDLANAQACRVTLDGKAVARRAGTQDVHLDLPAAAGQDIHYHQVEVNCGS